VLRGGADRERFKTLAAAQAQLVARVAEQLQKSGQSVELSVIPTEKIEGADSREYLRELGATLPREVSIFWTRRDVYSSEYNEADARARGELLARRPIVWDNFPVVDSEMWQLSFGAKRGGAPQLSDLALGYIAMPTSQFHASMLPLTTVADYAWDPRAYDPAKAQARALKMLYDERTATAMRKWSEIHHPPRDAAALAPRLDELQESLELIGLARERGLLRGELSSLLMQTRRKLRK
jgi:hyaluronoglucosaminidase